MKTIEINTYLVTVHTDTTSQELYLGSEIKYAIFEYKEATARCERADTCVLLEKKADKYQLNENMLLTDELELSDVYDTDYIDMNYFELVEEGEFELIEDKVLNGTEIKADELRSQVEEYLYKTYGRPKSFYGVCEINEKSVTIRLKEHSNNPTNSNHLDNFMSIVIANNNATAKRYRNIRELQFDDTDSFEFICSEINEYIEQNF